VARLFVAVKISPEVADRICRAEDQLAPLLKDIRWIRRESLHLTLKFLGHVDDGRIDDIQAAVQTAVASLLRFNVSCRGFGAFPDIRRPRVFWTGLEGGSLPRLAEATEQALEPLGFPREKREFRPHLTIGRWREGTRVGDALRRVVDEWRGHDFGTFAVDEAVLFQSTLRRDGAVYTALKSFPLRAN
jgi:2'-5' RNA ligase